MFGSSMWPTTGWLFSFLLSSNSDTNIFHLRQCTSVSSDRHLPLHLEDCVASLMGLPHANAASSHWFFSKFLSPRSPLLFSPLRMLSFVTAGWLLLLSCCCFLLSVDPCVSLCWRSLWHSECELLWQLLSMPLPLSHHSAAAASLCAAWCWLGPTLITCRYQYYLVPGTVGP